MIDTGVLSIGNNAFRDCSGLTSVIIPESVESIGRNAFRNCSGLTGLTIPGNVSSIGDSAFQNCSSLTGVTILGNLHFIGSNAFSDNNALIYIKFEGVAPTSGANFSSDNSYLIVNDENESSFLSEDADWINMLVVNSDTVASALNLISRDNVSDIKMGKVNILPKSTEEVELVLEIEETSDFPNWMGATIHQRTMNLEAVGDKRFYRIKVSE